MTYKPFLICAFIHDVACWEFGCQIFSSRITYYNNDCEMVMSAESYAAVIVALAVVLRTHCNPV